MKIFIAGIMQGSKQEHAIQDQDYRRQIREAVQANHPEAEIIDPYGMFPDSVDYDRTRARQVLFEMGEQAASSDILIAYLPSASMGTALEMLRAYDSGATIFTISPMATNWFIWGLSRRIFNDLDEFSTWVRGIELTDFVE
jgi:hypothetical protein